MTEELIKFAFSAGELSPHLLGRADLQNFDLGLAEATNFFVDYRGGASTRPGTKFGEFVQDEGEAARIIRFRFNVEIANTYLLIFTKDRLRFAQNGAYVVEADVSVTDITSANPAVITTSVAHGYSTGDWVYLSGATGMDELQGRIIQVGATTATTFECLDHNGTNIDATGYTAYSAGGVVNRVYTISSPYATADLAKIKYHQRADEVAFTHPDYPPYTLTRSAATSWTLAQETIGATLTAPSNVVLTPSTAGSAGYAVAVTAVDSDGVESLPSRYTFEEASVDFTTTAGSLKITWDAVAGADYYNVYRTRVFPTGSDVTYSEQVYFIGKAKGPQLIDNNIIPDTTQTPPKYRDPFAHGAITDIGITAAGSSYSKDDTVSVSGGGGSGFEGYPIVDDSGAILGVVIINPGSGYSSPSVLFGTSTGSGATATATAGATSGNYPSAVTVYSQRRTYGGQPNHPMTFIGSKILDYDNFDRSDTPNAADSYDYTLDADEVSPIRHLLAARNGLLVFTKQEVALAQGVSGDPISATGAQADNQIGPGASQVPPIFLDGQVIYVREKGGGVIAMSYNGYSRSWDTEEVSTLSNHFFTLMNSIVSWDFAEHPFHIVWAALEDGTFLAFTYLPSQKVIAWTQCETKGLVENVVVIEEDGVDVPYLLVKRYIGGKWVRLFEMLQPREFPRVEDAWCVDSGLSLTLSNPSADLTFGAATGTGVTVTASASVFVAGDVGSAIWAGGGKCLIASYISGTEITVDFEQDLTSVVRQDPVNTPLVISSGDWEMGPEVTTVSGLWHLEGQTVAILADGNVDTEQTVTNGSVTLGAAASKIIIGLPFNARLKTLPLSMQGAVIEGKRKSIKGLILRTFDTRGLSAGDRLTNMYEQKDRTDEDWGDPTRLRTAMRELLFQSSYDEEGQFYIEQTYPLPATILGYVVEMSAGDVEKG